MSSDFSRLCAFARAEIAVPPAPMGAIRDAATRPIEPGSFRSKRFAGAAAALFSAAALAAAASILGHTHVFFDSNLNLKIATDSGKYVRHPTRNDLRAAAARADFRVVYPSGLPPGTTPMQMIGAGRSAIAITYDLPGAWRRSDHLLWVVLANAKIVSGPAHSITNPEERYRWVLTPGGHRLRATQVWQVGNEVVIIQADNITPAEIANIKHAMLSPH